MIESLRQKWIPLIVISKFFIQLSPVLLVLATFIEPPQLVFTLTGYFRHSLILTDLQRLSMIPIAFSGSQDLTLTVTSSLWFSLARNTTQAFSSHNSGSLK